MALPDNGLVDIHDIMYTAPSGELSDLPSNTNPRDEAVLSVTDLVDCCAAPRRVRGNWYYPSENRSVGLGEGNAAAFQANRGPNEEINGPTVYGSVRLYRRYTPSERGHFRCELPSAENPSVNQILYVNIGEFITAHF